MLTRPVARLSLVFFAALFAFAGQAWATAGNLTSFKQAYPAAKALSCKACHQNPVGRKGDLNAYGLALQKLPAPAVPKLLKVEDYRAVEMVDSDGDGVSNREEIKAGTHPGDPASVLKPTN